MGFFDGLKSGLGLADAPGIVATKSLGGIMQGGSTSLSMFDSSYGLRRGSRELLAAYRDNPHIRKVVRLIANQLASTEFHLEAEKTAKAAKAKALKARGKGVAKVVPSAAEEKITEHTFLDFLYGGNPLMPGSSGMLLSWVYYLLKGEFFWMAVPTDNDVGWMVIPPHWVDEVPGDTDGEFVIRWGNSSKNIRVPYEFMLWVRDPDVMNPYGRGAGTGDSLRDEVDTDEYASQLMRVTLANKGLMDGILAVTGADRDALKAARRDHELGHRGVEKAGKLMVVEADSVKYTQLSHAFSELKLLELRDHEKQTIEETFMVPPELFGKVEGSNRATSYMAQKNFAANVLIPNLNMFVLEVGLKWLPLFDKTGRLTLSYTSPAPEDHERRIELMKVSPASFTDNEVRAEALLPPVEGGDELRKPPPALVPAAAAPPGGNPNKTPGEEPDEDEIEQVARAILTRTAPVTPAIEAATISQAQIDAILALYTPEELAYKLGPMWQTRMQEIAASELSALGVTPAWDVVNPLIEDHVREFGLDRLKVPIGTSRALASAEIQAGIMNFESIGEIASRLEAAGATDQTWRSVMIARTETVRSTNLAREVSWRSSGLPGLKKKWLSGLTPTTRASHAALHGKIVGLQEVFEFSPGLEPGKAGSTTSPGSSGVAAHDINCVCTTIAFDPEHGKAIDFGSDEHLGRMKAFDAQQGPWEAEATKVISDFYAGIEKATMDILGVKP